MVKVTIVQGGLVGTAIRKAAPPLTPLFLSDTAFPPEGDGAFWKHQARYTEFFCKLTSDKRSLAVARRRSGTMNVDEGFTLLELMIVLAIVLIIAAIAIPSMKEAKINADEASAVGSIRAINTAEVSYQAGYGGFANVLANLGGAEPCHKSSETACLIDDSLAGGAKAGYKFSAVGGSPSGEANTSYVAGAAPEVFEGTGKRMFCSTEKDVIRVDLNAAGSTTPPDAEQCAGFTALK